MKTTLGEIFEIGSGGTPSKTHPEYYGGSIPWVKTGDLKDEYLYSVEDCITEEGLKSSSAKMYQPGTVLIAMYGATIGATSILKIDACTNQACAAFKPSKDVMPEYLYYFLRSKKQKFISDGVGGAQPNISAGYLKKVSIDIRTIEEQEKIVTVLDKLNAVIKKRQREIDELDNLIKARFVELFYNWEENYSPEPLGQYLTDITYGFTNPMPDAEDGPWKITAKDVANGIVNLDTARRTPQTCFDELTAKSKPDIGDVLLTKDGTLGRTAVVETDGICVNQSVAVLKANDRILPKFLSILLQMPKYQKDMAADAGGGTIKHIYITKVVKMPIVVPNRNEQEEFLEFVKQVDKSKFVVQKTLDETRILFDSLMQKYFG